jgi:predicted acylesterase/phospholipase RssA
MTSLEGVLSASNAEPAGHPAVAGQVVLVMQGGGAQAAYQGGVYQALHEANLEPDWVIGTSIGAINGSIIAGNKVASRLERLREFWSRIESRPTWPSGPMFWKCGEPAFDPADRRARLLFTQRGVLVGS